METKTQNFHSNLDLKVISKIENIALINSVKYLGWSYSKYDKEAKQRNNHILVYFTDKVNQYEIDCFGEDKCAEIKERLQTNITCNIQCNVISKVILSKYKQKSAFIRLTLKKIYLLDDNFSSVEEEKVEDSVFSIEEF